MKLIGKRTRRGRSSNFLRLTSIVLLIWFLTFRLARAEDRLFLVLYAFEAEGQLLAGQMEAGENRTILGRPVSIGRLAGEKIVLAESGIGMTNAAMTAQRLIDEFKPGGVIFSGIAGAIDTSVLIGDIVICRSWATHDYVYHGADGPQPREIGVYSISADSVIRLAAFPVDSAMFQTARDLPPASIQLEKIGQREPRILLGGEGVSGNAFIDNREKRIWLRERFGAMITDMETAAVAQVCYVNNIPFIGFRSASDLAGGSGSSSADAELERFFAVAAANSSKVVMRFLEIY